MKDNNRCSKLGKIIRQIISSSGLQHYLRKNDCDFLLHSISVNLFWKWFIVFVLLDIDAMINFKINRLHFFLTGSYMTVFENLFLALIRALNKLTIHITLNSKFSCFMKSCKWRSWTQWRKQKKNKWIMDSRLFHLQCVKRPIYSSTKPFTGNCINDVCLSHDQFGKYQVVEFLKWEGLWEIS